MKHNRTRKGFTLIELLVVIAIIGILSSIVLASLQSARDKARIVQVVSDFKQIQTALELYFADHGNYPITITTNDWGETYNNRSVCPAWTGLPNGYAPEDVIPGLVPNYLPTFPQDPYLDLNEGYEWPPGSGSMSGTNCYMYRSDGIDYVFLNDNMTKMSTTDFESQRWLLDPRRDAWPADPGGQNTSYCVLDSGPYWAWKIVSTPKVRCY